MPNNLASQPYYTIIQPKKIYEFVPIASFPVAFLSLILNLFLLLLLGHQRRRRPRHTRPSKPSRSASKSSFKSTTRKSAACPTLPRKRARSAATPMPAIPWQPRPLSRPTWPVNSTALKAALAPPLTTS